MLGGLGDDTFWLFSEDMPADPANTVDGIQGTVTVSPTGAENALAMGESNALIVSDRGDVSGGGDTVTIDTTTIDGVFDMGSGIDVTYNPDQLEVINVNTSGEADTINVNFNGVGGSELNFFSINGAGGSDQFVLQSPTPTDASVILDGDEDVVGAPNTGANDDLLDLSALPSPRTVELTAHGTIDGFEGNDAALQFGFSEFRNIDAILAPAGGSDSLVMDIFLDRTHWDVGGSVSGYGPFGSSSLTLTDSLTDTGVLVSDDATLSDIGNASSIGRPTGANPITPIGSQDDLAWSGFENLTGSSAADDRFDFRGRRDGHWRD